MSFKSIKNSTVLLRVDYNITNEMQDSTDLARINNSIPTIKELLKAENKIIIATHIGRPKGKIQPMLSTAKITKVFCKILKENKIDVKIVELDQLASFEQTKWKIDNSEANIYFLENTRFHSDEQSKDTKKRKILAAQYATLADFFVDEAFAVSHRKEATNYDIKVFLPSMIGLMHRKEMESLKKLRSNPDNPYYFIMGGGKLETKLNLVKKVLLVADKVLLAGKLCFTFVQAAKELAIDGYKDINIYNSYVDKEFIQDAKDLLIRYPNKILLPSDFVVGEDEKIGKYCADIGPKTIKAFIKQLDDAKTIFWNGPLGRFEIEPYNKATLELSHWIANHKGSYSVIGGGDTLAAVTEEDFNKFDFVSMGGGASLDLLGR